MIPPEEQVIQIIINPPGEYSHLNIVNEAVVMQYWLPEDKTRLINDLAALQDTVAKIKEEEITNHD